MNTQMYFSFVEVQYLFIKLNVMRSNSSFVQNFLLYRNPQITAPVSL